MELLIDFPGGDRVDAHFGSCTVKTDQPSIAGIPQDPTPFALFLASIGTCAGIFVLSFCNQRGLSTEGIKIVQRVNQNQGTHMVEIIDLEIQIPATFPEKYREALVRSAELCAVKRHLENPPKFNTFTKVVES